MRLKNGEQIRVFHPDKGEFVAVFEGKEAVLGKRIKGAFIPHRRIHLYVPPLSKDRMDFLMEKATELGITEYHPLITERTQLRKVNEDRLRAQVIEAAEQCERLDIPVIHAPAVLARALETAAGEIWAGIERIVIPGEAIAEGRGSHADKIPFPSPTGSAGNDEISVFIGPAGGWTDQEKELLLTKTKVLDLGDNILRSETAALVGLSIINTCHARVGEHPRDL